MEVYTEAKCVSPLNMCWLPISKELHFFFFFLSPFEPLPFRGVSLWSQGIYPSLPRYTPCILASRVGSALPHRVNSHQTNLVDYFVYSRFFAFHGRNHALRRQTQRIGNRTLDFYPNGENRTIRPPGHGGSFFNAKINWDTLRTSW